MNPFNTSVATANPFNINAVNTPAPVDFSQYQSITPTTKMNDVISAYPFTPEAKSILTKTPTSFQQLPEGVGGQTNIPDYNIGSGNRPYVDIFKSPLQNTSTPIELNSRLINTGVLPAAHEAFNALFTRTAFSPQDFNSAWEQAAKSNATLQGLDKELGSAEAAPAYRSNGEDVSTDPYQLATERFALAGKYLGAEGLSSIPSGLQKYYKQYLTDYKQQNPSATTPGASPQPAPPPPFSLYDQVGQKTTPTPDYLHTTSPAPDFSANKLNLTTPAPFTQNPIADNNAAAEALVTKFVPAAPAIMHGFATGDWGPYQEQHSTYLHNLLPQATDTPDQQKQKYVNLAMGGIGADTKIATEAGGAWLDAMHPQDVTFLSKAADSIKAGQELNVKNWQIFQDTLAHYGLKTPATQAKAADFIDTALGSAVQKTFNATLDKEVIQPARANPSKLDVNTPQVQPRQANGWWDSFKKTITDESGFVRNPLAPGETPPLPEGESGAGSSVNDITRNPNEGQLPVAESPPASGETQNPEALANKDPSGLSLQELNQSRKINQPLGETLPPEGKYVKPPTLDIKPAGTDKATAKSIRAEYTGVKNEQIVRGNQLAEEIRKAAPKEQDGMFWYKAAKGDTQVLTDLLKNPKFEPYKAGIESALNLSPEAKAALAKGDKYYAEAGQVAKTTGTISNVREEYMNRIYKPEPPKDFVKTEMSRGLQQTTSHAKARVFENEIQAVEAGKTFATTNYADALSIHNEEMARVNTARSLMDTMQAGGLGAWTDHVPAGWTQVGQLRKGAEIFAAPKGIADGLRAITDPDFMKRVDTISALQKYQGFVKTIDLSFSFFHHLTFVTQTLSSKRGLTTLAQMVTGGLRMEAPAFKAMELDFVRNGGMTTNVAATQDIMRNLSVGDDNISKLLQLPVGKQINAAMQASNRFLFEKMQRFLKVMTYQRNVANWAARHPNATNEAVAAAKAGFTKATNAEFGGLNWQTMGVTKSNQSILRTIFLAPDWLTSAGAQTKYAFSDTGTAGQQARLTLVKAIVGGKAIIEGINKLMTGHFTDQNPKGHTMEIEVAPNVYISLVRGAPGELVKFISNIAQTGGKGAFQYLSGKLAPLARTGLGLASGVNYAGQSIWQGGKKPTALSKTFGGLMFILQNAAPIPFGLSAVGNEVKSTKMTPLGIAATAAGIGRFAAPSGKKASSKNPFSI